MYNTEEIIARKIHDSIVNDLTRIGLLFRVFYRSKSAYSIARKLENNPGKYTPEGKKIQDLYGIRVALYFSDDLPLAQKALKNSFEYDHASSSIDENNINKFSATRCNLIFRLPIELVEESSVLASNNLIDKTFEVQFRTILSEGWHEVDHDLRYKCSNDWDNNNDLSRALNGIYASLETSDWSMLKLFEELAYKHYKAGKWEAMLRHKFRLRFQDCLSSTLALIITNERLGKQLYRVNRDLLLKSIFEHNIKIPININNIVYLCNFLYLKNNAIDGITPEPIKNILNESMGKET